MRAAREETAPGFCAKSARIARIHGVGMGSHESPTLPALVLGGPMFYAHIQQCEAKLTEASAALVTLADEVTTLRAAGAQECEAAIAELLTSTGQLQEAFEFVDVLAHNVRTATALVDATERRLDTLEAGLTLPRSIAQLPPVQFEAHQFSQQLQRRERATIPELLELSELTSRAEREAQADAAELEHLSEIELKLEQMARDVGPLTCPPNRPPAHPHARTPERPSRASPNRGRAPTSVFTAARQAAARATNLASALQEKARLYSGPGSFLQRLSQQVTGAPPPVPGRPTTPTELRLD